ncbi:MAG: TOBE domain-containing protein [Acidimicrobiia bacterium]|nr:TOBE domain-containing protein [Acidimicrobiia bacterium]
MPRARRPPPQGERLPPRAVGWGTPARRPRPGARHRPRGRAPRRTLRLPRRRAPGDAPPAGGPDPPRSGRHRPAGHPRPTGGAVARRPGRDHARRPCEQAGRPEDVYAHPATSWVAEFLGAAEVVPGTATAGVVECELGRFDVDPALEGTVDVVVRPETVVIEADGRPDATRAAEVVEREFYGHDQLVCLELPSGRRVHSRTTGMVPWRHGDRVRVHVEGPVRVLGPDRAS